MMISRRIAASVVAASVAMVQAQPVFADGDALVGGIIGAIIGGAIVNEANKGQRRATTKTRTRAASSGQTSAQREANREVQTALNYFGYPVGTPDGSLGPKSRSAIGEYQATLGYTPTGQLTEYERTLLVGSYQRGMAGGALTLQQAAANPMGMRGLLVTWRDEAAGVPAPAVAAAPSAADSSNPFKPKVPDAAAQAVPEGTLAATEAAPVAPLAAAAALPSFLATGGTGASLASYCNKVSMLGTYATAASMSDPTRALGEQFCLARGYSIALGEDMASQVAGFTPEQIAAQCEGFGPAMKGEIAALSLKPMQDVLKDVQTFALSTGMAPAQLSGTAKICLSVGYRTDNMDVAVASALILAGLGEGAYAELLGHHLSQGYGATARPDLALAWYEQGLAAAGNPQMAVFAPDQPDRLELIRKASLMVAGVPDATTMPEVVPAALPTFEAPVAAPDAAQEAAAVPAPAEPVAAPAAEGVVGAPAAPVIALADPAPATMTADKLDALPFVAQLPFLLFRN
jgi:peptidoglycan hydrolase-like protein with peptidoglycan-binding domain